MDTIRFNTGYFDDAVRSLDEIIERAEKDLHGIKFDTLVGTGFSGAVVVPAMAMWLDVNYVLVRKDHDDSHHSGRLVGTLGSRWIFVDDFISMGGTRTRVMQQVSNAVTNHNKTWDGGFTTEYVGDYLYVDASRDLGEGFKPMDMNEGLLSKQTMLNERRMEAFDLRRMEA